MSDQVKERGYLNPRQVIERGLPDLLIPSGDDQTVQASSLTEWFNGHLDRWSNFEKELTQFSRSEDLQKAFHLCQHVKADNDLEYMKHVSPHFAGFEHTEIGEERDLQGRFTENVLERVICVPKCITDPRDISGHAEKLKKLPLTNDISIGSAKTVPLHKRKRHEPDIVFKTPRSGDNHPVRIVGELKFPRTCPIDVGEIWDYPDSWKQGSMRHIFGQVARDMRENGTRYGFVSTYDSTVFLKISRKKQDGRHSLLYSEPIPHSQALVDDNPHGLLSQFSVRFVLLWLIHRAQREDRSWAIKPSEIEPRNWTDAGPAYVYGSDFTPKETPVKRLINKVRTRIGRLTLKPRRSQTTSPDTSMSSVSVGNTPDDPDDPDYEDSGIDTPCPPSTTLDDFTSASEDEDERTQGSYRARKLDFASGAL